MERLLKPSEVAELLGVSKDTARTKMATMPGAVKLGDHTIRITESALEAYIANNTIRPIRTTKIERRKRS